MTRAIFIAGVCLGAAAGATADDARDRGRAATVRVASAADGQTGSGVVFARGGPHLYVLTAHHLVPAAKSAEVRTAGGRVATAEVVARSADQDLAVLRVAATDGFPDPVKLAGPGATVEKGLSVGWSGAAPTVLDEVVKGKVRVRRPGVAAAALFWEAERKQAAGRSGGPLLDPAGAVVGVASGHDDTAGYYVHVDEIHGFLRRSGLRWLTDGGR